MLIEAMSCGMACVGTNVPGIATLISDSDTGLLADLTADSLTEKLIAVSINTRLQKRLGEAAREFVVKNFDLNRLLERETQLLSAVAQKHRMPKR